MKRGKLTRSLSVDTYLGHINNPIDNLYIKESVLILDDEGYEESLNSSQYEKYNPSRFQYISYAEKENSRIIEQKINKEPNWLDRLMNALSCCRHNEPD